MRSKILIHLTFNVSALSLLNNQVDHKVFSVCFLFSVKFFLQLFMYIISADDFSLFCSNSARKRLILPAVCSPQKSLILLEILPAEFIQAFFVPTQLKTKPFIFYDFML